MTQTSTETSTDWSGLQVPDEPGVYFCARHKNVTTRLRCGRCEKPICPKCTVMGPIGARCHDCGLNRSSHIYQVKPWHFAGAFGMAFVLSLIGAILVGSIGLFIVFFAPVIGSFVGKAVIWATRGKRGKPLAWAATAGAVVGALLPMLPLLLGALALSAVAAGAPATGAAGVALTGILGDLLWSLIFLALVIPAIWYWLK